MYGPTRPTRAKARAVELASLCPGSPGPLLLRLSAGVRAGNVRLWPAVPVWSSHRSRRSQIEL